MSNHSVKALNDSIVGRCHVAKSNPVSQVFQFRVPTKIRLTLPGNRTCSCIHRVAYLFRRVNQRQLHKDTGGTYL